MTSWPRVKPKPETFWSHVDRSAGPNGCWIWTAYIAPSGYGQAGKCFYAHRMAYELLIGPIPVGLHIDHLCRNRACVNPAHMEPVTSAENSRRGIGVGEKMAALHRAKTHCPHGHEYTEENTRRSRGKRLCKECQRRYALRRYYLSAQGDAT